MTRMPKPVSSWTRRGFMSSDPPTAEDIKESIVHNRHQCLIGFYFRGEGWYPSHRVLVLQVAKDGYELYFFDSPSVLADFAEVVAVPVMQ